MHIKFLAHGTGDPTRAANYLTDKYDHSGKARPEVKVICGDPHIVAALVDTLAHKHRYTSGVISWAPEDDPTEEEKLAVVEDFERVAFAGLEPNQYSWAAISHGNHVHCFVARVELTTGKAMNIAPPNWMATFDPLRDYWNHSMGWARPDDPARARPIQVGRQMLAMKSSKNQRRLAHLSQGPQMSRLQDALEIEPDTKQEIADWLLALVHAGIVKKRIDVIAALEKIGSINRESEDYVSIRLNKSEKKIRLKGAFFVSSFDADEYLKKLGEEKISVPRRSAPNQEEAAKAKAILEIQVAKREAYNRSRYPVPVLVPGKHINQQQLQKEASIDESVRKVEDKSVRRGESFAEQFKKIYDSTRKRLQNLIGLCARAVESIESARRASEFDHEAHRRAERAMRVVRSNRNSIGSDILRSKNLDANK